MKSFSFSFKGKYSILSLNEAFNKLERSNSFTSICVGDVTLPDNIPLEQFLMRLSSYFSKSTPELELLGWNFNNETILLLIRLLKNNTLITSLIISSLRRERTALCEFFEYYMSEDISLDSLTLRDNEISMHEARDIGVFLTKSPLLFTFRVLDYKFYDAQSRAVTDGLKQNTFLREIDLHFTSVGSDIINEFEKLLETNESLEIVELPEWVDSSRLNKNLDRNKQILLANRIRETVCSGELVSLNRCKLMVIGNGQAGKTSTINSLLHRYEKIVDSTVVADVKDLAKISLTSATTSDWKSILTSMNNSMVNSDLKSLVKQNTKRDSDARSFSESRSAHSEELKPVNKRFLELLVDVKKEDYSEQRKGKFKISLYKKKVDQSINDMVDNIQLLIWDFGGQRVFYSLHHLFLTQNGVYILVFRLDKLLTNNSSQEEYEKEKKSISFWISSLKMHAPGCQITIVGTHYDKLKKECRKDETKLNTSLLEVNESIKKLTHGVLKAKNLQTIENETLWFFPLDNSSLKNAEETANSIRDSVTTQVKSSKFAETKIKSSWVYFMDFLFNKGEPLIKFDEVYRLSQENGIVTDLNDVLQYYKSVGLIFYFPEIDINENILPTDIVLQPQWLLKTLAQVLFAPKIHTEQVLTSLSIHGKNMLHEYLDQGVLKPALLKELWSDQTGDSISFLISLSLKMLFFSVYLSSSEATEASLTERRFIVPSMLPKKVLKANVTNNTKVVLSFKTYLAKGIYERVISIVMNLANSLGESSEPQLSKLWSYFAVNSFKYKEVEDDLRFFVLSHPALKQIIFYADEDRMLPFLALFVSKVVETLRKDPLGIKTIPTLLLPVRVRGEDLFCPYEKVIPALMGMNQRIKWENEHGFIKEILMREVQCYFEPSVFLDKEKKRRNPRPIQQPEEETFDVFLAHEWGIKRSNHDKVMGLADRLANAGLKVWVDETNIASLIDRDIIKGITQSKKVVIILTKQYIQNMEIETMWCTKEFRYIMNTKEGIDDIILVLFDEALSNPNSWGKGTFFFQVGKNKKYIDMSSNRKIDENFRALINRIQN